jgi:hypothetical protein
MMRVAVATSLPDIEARSFTASVGYTQVRCRCHRRGRELVSIHFASPAALNDGILGTACPSSLNWPRR